MTRWAIPQLHPRKKTALQSQHTLQKPPPRWTPPGRVWPEIRESSFSQLGGTAGADQWPSRVRASWRRMILVVSKERVGGESGWETTTSG